MIRIRMVTEAGSVDGTFTRSYIVERRSASTLRWIEIDRAITRSAAETIKARHERPAPKHCEKCGKPIAGAPWGRCYDCGSVCCRTCKGEGNNLCWTCWDTKDGRLADWKEKAL